MQMSRENPDSARACGGLFTRRVRWGLSWRGWVAAIAAAVATGGILLTGIHPFLAQTHRVASGVLVVEGWIDKYAIEAAAREFQQNGYTRVLATGGPVIGLGGYVNDFQTSASVGADNLKAAGVPADRVEPVVSKVSGRDRTYNSALALRDWFRARDVTITNLNVVTEDAHGRRTRLLYEKAFGSGVDIGVISIANPDYDARRWWRYSQGVKEVFSESVAYLYARLFFWPASSPSAPAQPDAKPSRTAATAAR